MFLVPGQRFPSSPWRDHSGASISQQPTEETEPEQMSTLQPMGRTEAEEKHEKEGAAERSYNGLTIIPHSSSSLHCSGLGN